MNIEIIREDNQSSVGRFRMACCFWRHELSSRSVNGESQDCRHEWRIVCLEERGQCHARSGELAEEARDWQGVACQIAC